MQVVFLGGYGYLFSTELWGLCERLCLFIKVSPPAVFVRIEAAKTLKSVQENRLEVRA